MHSFRKTMLGYVCACVLDEDRENILQKERQGESSLCCLPQNRSYQIRVVAKSDSLSQNSRRRGDWRESGGRPAPFSRDRSLWSFITAAPPRIRKRGGPRKTPEPPEKTCTGAAGEGEEGARKQGERERERKGERERGRGRERDRGRRGGGSAESRRRRLASEGNRSRRAAPKQLSSRRPSPQKSHPEAETGGRDRRQGRVNKPHKQSSGH